MMGEILGACYCGLLEDQTRQVVHQRTDEIKRLIKRVWLPTDAPWLNPIEKLLRWLRRSSPCIGWPASGSNCGSGSMVSLTRLPLHQQNGSVMSGCSVTVSWLGQFVQRN